MFQALKTWSTWPLFHITKDYLDGTEVSSLNEARLGYDQFNHDVHMYAPAYTESEFPEILNTCSTIIFNTFAQWRQFKPLVEAYVKETGKASSAVCASIPNLSEKMSMAACGRHALPDRASASA